MLLQALNEYARRHNLVESIELTNRTTHLLLNLRADGTVSLGAPWLPLDSPDPKDKKGEKKILGATRLLPSLPGFKNGGVAEFLADQCFTVFGVNPESGVGLIDDPATNRPKIDDPTIGWMRPKAFLHFWERIEKAHEATKLDDLRIILLFRDQYLATESSRNSLKFIGIRPIGKEDKPTLCALVGDDHIPIKGRTLSFAVEGRPIYEEHLESDRPLRIYWSKTYRTEAFSEKVDLGGETIETNSPPDANKSSRDDAAKRLGICLVTGLTGQQIAESHKPQITGVPGLQGGKGFLVSFDKESPAFSSYGFERARNAPVSEQAAAGYALALNALLSDPRSARRLSGGLVLCTWLRDHSEWAHTVLDALDEPTADGVEKFFDSVPEGRPRQDLKADRYYSASFASNGGRVVVRRWLDRALGEVVADLDRWFKDLAIEEIPRPTSSAKGKGKAPRDNADRAKSPPYRSILALAWATARTPGDVQTGVYDTLYRAALEGANAESLLAQAIHRIRIAAIQSGANVRYQVSRFALVKMILIRSEDKTMAEDKTMPIERQLCEVLDAPYNCGRLLAVLDDIQYAAQKKLGADIIARFYGNASTFPGNSFPRLLNLTQAHLNKLSKDGDTVAKGLALQRKLFDICSLFPASAAGVPEFPGQLNIREQGRFALGFYQQKAKDQRDSDAYKAAEAAKAVPDPDDE